MTEKLDKAAWIRIAIFAALLVWCGYVSVAYSIEANPGVMTKNFIDTSEIKDIYIDGSDFTWAVRLMGYGVDGLLSFAIMMLILVCMIAEAVFCVIPTLLLRFIGVRKTTVITRKEYKLTKIMYFAAIGIALIAALIVTKFTGIIIITIYTAEWACLLLIYTLTIRKRARMTAEGNGQTGSYFQNIQEEKNREDLQ